MLTINNLTKKYKGNPVINGISLSISKGESLAIIGPNGSGKSTLLNLILGTIRPLSGTIDCDKRCISAAVSRTGFINDMSVIANIELFISLSGTSRDLLTPLLAKLEIDFLNKTFSELSLGMKQKVSLLLALLDLRDLILLDEPFAHLDQPSIHFLANLIAREKNHGKSFILTSHTFEHLELLCDRFIFLNHGKIVKDIRKSELLNMYSSIDSAYQQILVC